jgi:hypothetical protein
MTILRFEKKKYGPASWARSALPHLTKLVEHSPAFTNELCRIFEAMWAQEMEDLPLHDVDKVVYFLSPRCRPNIHAFYRQEHATRLHQELSPESLRTLDMALARIYTQIGQLHQSLHAIWPEPDSEPEKEPPNGQS